ncbi:MAG: hypothetical protein ACI9JY_003037 [Saprospiraceae bacterium]
MKNDVEVEGLIQDNDLSVYSRLIAFKKGKKSKDIQVLNPEMIKGFITDNGQKHASIHVNFAFQTKGGMTHQYSGTRFVRVLQEGKISIYELRDLNARAWFIQKEGEQLELLSLNRKLVDKEVAILVNNISDCGCIDYDETLPTKMNDVVATVAKYNNFVDSPMFGVAAVLETSEMERP